MTSTTNGEATKAVTKTASKTPKAKPAKHGFPGLHCLGCGDEGCVRLDLVDFNFCCMNCDWEGTPADVRETLEVWAKVLTWCETAPVVS